jgi:GT2 family glycosyltransferase
MLSTPTLQKDTATGRRGEEDLRFRILEVELAQPLPTFSAVDEKTGKRYQYACCLVRLHTHPLGLVTLPFRKDELYACDYVQLIWQELGGEIIEHLHQDNLPAVVELDSGGLIFSGIPSCIQEREAFFTTAPFVSVIISTHDRPEQLSLCLPALLAQHYPRYEIIIVDNAPSTSATADLVRLTYGHVPYLHYVQEDVPGLSRGLNRGIAEARGEILAFTDDDVMVDSFWLLQLARAFSIASDVICVTGLVLPWELETPAQILFEQYGGFSKGFCRHVYDMAENRPGEPLYPYTAGRFGTGASMAFRPAFLRTIGGFDPALQCGMDIAAFFQTVKQGHKLVYEPAALVYHTHRRSYAELQKQIYNYGVALTAYLTKSVLERPQRLFELVGKIPYGLFFTLSSKSPKNHKKSLHYPKDLTMLELKGMLYGPFAYLQRKWQLKRLKKIMAV